MKTTEGRSGDTRIRRSAEQQCQIELDHEVEIKAELQAEMIRGGVEMRKRAGARRELYPRATRIIQ